MRLHNNFVKTSLNCLFTLSAPLCLMLSVSTAAQTYYKWQNDEGNWVYGSHPPVGSDAIPVKTYVESSEPIGADAAPTEEQIAQKANQETCERAKANLKALNSDAIIQTVDENGATVTLSDAQREEEKGKAQQAIDRYCS